MTSQNDLHHLKQQKLALQTCRKTAVPIAISAHIANVTNGRTSDGFAIATDDTLGHFIFH